VIINLYMPMHFLHCVRLTTRLQRIS